MSVTDGDRVIAPGVPLELNDGTTVRVRFGYKQLQRLEKRFGSLQALFTGMEAGIDWFHSYFLATVKYGRSDDEFGCMTPAQLNALAETDLEMQKKAERGPNARQVTSPHSRIADAMDD
jgi:hypothetical protein